MGIDTDLFVAPYKTGKKYFFVRHNGKIRMVWNYIARMYAMPYEKINGEMVSCSDKYTKDEFEKLFKAGKIVLDYGDEEKVEEDFELNF